MNILCKFNNKEKLTLFFFSLSRIVEQIANKEMSPTEEEIIETKVDHWIVPAWSQLNTRTVGPVIKAGGHDW